MATSAQIASVQLALPDEAATYGVTDAIIGAQIDATSQTKAILFGLRAIASKIASVEDVTESGSSRTNQFHSRLMAMIADWQLRSDAEDAAIGNLPVKQPAKLHTAKRPDLLFPTIGT